MIPVVRRRKHGRYPGVYRATVVNVTDPLQAHRVQVSIPSLRRSTSAWAPTLRQLGGRPQVGDEVLVGFEAAQLEHPYVLGVLATEPAPPIALSDENGNAVTLASSGIEITSGAEVHIKASQIRFSAGMGSADAAMWTFSGAVKSQTVITDSVIAASYTPGTGNLM